MNRETIEQIDLRFQSGNSIPVERAYLKQEEWQEIKRLLCAEPIAWGWKREGMEGFALGHNPPTRENLHFPKDFDSYTIVPLIEGVK